MISLAPRQRDAQPSIPYHHDEDAQGGPRIASTVLLRPSVLTTTAQQQMSTMTDAGQGPSNGEHKDDPQQMEYLHIPQFIACTAIGFEPLAVSTNIALS